ncbi:MAG TPA: DUF3006 domain-containing protein [Clostridiales bacterium]|nr:DUF3006 domain-containing protein [Clostridiales bacterium]
MKYIIDRFEGEYAICQDENRKMVNIEKVRIPAEAKEGYVLIHHGDKFIIDIDETNRRKQKIQRLMDELWK